MAVVRHAFGAVVMALLLAAHAPAVRGQQPVPPRSDTTRTDTTHRDTTRTLAPVVVTGTRLSDVDERTPVQVDVVPFRQVAPGPVAAAAALGRLTGVSTFDDQGTRLQPTLTLRGFTASPVVGVPQGVSVFLDGVRINEPDAQQVNFDLIPMDAVDHADLVRGPGTLYGKNALAGALVLFTKRGDATPHLDLSAESGAWGYRGLRLGASGERDGVDAFLTARATQEDGYRVESQARTRMAFLNVGRRRDSSDVALTVLYAHDRIKQAGSLPESWLDVDPRANFTAGDFFEPELWHLALRGRQQFAGGTLRGNVFHRRNDTQQFNVNIDEPSTRAFIDTRFSGGTAEWTRPTALAGLPLGLTVGAEYSRSDVTYRVFSEATAESPIAPGCDPSTGLCENSVVNEDDASLYAQGVLQLAPWLWTTASLRADYVRVPFRDRVTPPNSGTHTFNRVSPRLGLNYAAGSRFRGYTAVSTGFRAPAALELACADEASPCPLPFSLGDDPRLAPVTVVDYESGIDWEPWEGASLDVVAYREDVRDEIVFVPSRTTAGFFQNVPRTRRQGIEASTSVQLTPALRAHASYALLDATYRSTVLIASSMPEADSARPGDHFPLAPRHVASAGLAAVTVAGTSVLQGDLSVHLVSSQFLRGNDANVERVLLDSASGSTVSGRVPGYGTLDLSLGWEHPRFTVSANITNLTDRRYATFGIFGANPKGPIGGPRPAEPVLERFLNPGYPRAVTVSVGLKW